MNIIQNQYKYPNVSINKPIAVLVDSSTNQGQLVALAYGYQTPDLDGDETSPGRIHNLEDRPIWRIGGGVGSGEEIQLPCRKSRVSSA